MAQGKRVVDTTPQKVHDYFTSKGWSSNAAWGIAGNVSQESGFASNAYNRNNKEESYGLFQFNSIGNPNAYAEFKKRYQKPLTQATALEQMEFVDYQLRNSERKAGEGLKKASSPYEAGMTFGRLFERPQTVEQSRGKNAENFARGGLKGEALEAYNRSIVVSGGLRSAQILTNPLGHVAGAIGAVKPIAGVINEGAPIESDSIYTRVGYGIVGLGLLITGLIKLKV
jgi:hypothetical protein